MPCRQARRHAHVPIEGFPLLANLPDSMPTSPQHANTAATPLVSSAQHMRSNSSSSGHMADSTDASQLRTQAKGSAGAQAAPHTAVMLPATPAAAPIAQLAAMGQLQTALASPSELHTPDPAAAQLLRHIATAPAAGNSAEGQASPVETALAIARMVRQCTAQLRGTPPHLRCWLPPMTTQGRP